MNNLARIDIAEIYNKQRKDEYIQFLKELGDGIRFEEDTWRCSNRIRSSSESTTNVSIYFKGIPDEYKEIVKFFVLVRLTNAANIRTVKANVFGLSIFLMFLSREYNAIDLEKCDIGVAYAFKQYLERTDLALNTKKPAWSALNIFFKFMKDWGNANLKNPFCDNPYPKSDRLDYKYIPEAVAMRLDDIFKHEDVQLHWRCIYWILRLIPSRISEITSMSINCLKEFDNHYVIFIPTWKQNGGNKEPIYRSIHLKNIGIASYLIKLIKQQQVESESLQDFMPADRKGALFTCRKICYYYKKLYTQNRYFVVNGQTALVNLKKICCKNNVFDKNGNVFKLTTHQFRHNGITDRLEAGFTTAQIAEMTGHHGDAMIYNAYAHLNLKPETIIEKQQYVINEPKDYNNPYVLFGGRILGMEEQLEKRLLKNIRAHRVRGGICSDITGCKSEMWNCLDCHHFIPDKDQLPYFKDQVLSWQSKAEKFKDYPLIKSNALKNAGLFEKMVKKIAIEDDEINE